LLRLYVDSAERAAAEPLLRQGLFAGLTTNPTLLQRSGVRETQLPDLVGWAVEAGAETVFLQTWGTDTSELVERGHGLRAIGPQVIVKVPVTRSGIEAAALLAGADVPVLVTALYAASQIVPSIAAGAQFAAPYLGRMDDAGLDALAEVGAMKRAIEMAGANTRVLAASVRTPEQVTELLDVGVQDITLSPQGWGKFFDNALTSAAVQEFDAASAHL
jgi:transaldolase